MSTNMNGMLRLQFTKAYRNKQTNKESVTEGNKMKHKKNM